MILTLAVDDGLDNFKPPVEVIKKEGEDDSDEDSIFYKRPLKLDGSLDDLGSRIEKSKDLKNGSKGGFLDDDDSFFVNKEDENSPVKAQLDKKEEESEDDDILMGLGANSRLEETQLDRLE